MSVSEAVAASSADAAGMRMFGSGTAARATANATTSGSALAKVIADPARLFSGGAAEREHERGDPDRGRDKKREQNYGECLIRQVRRLQAVRAQLQPMHATYQGHQQGSEPHSMRHQKCAGPIEPLRRQPVFLVG